MSVEQVPSRSGDGGAGSALRSNGRWWTLGVVTMATFMLMLDITVVNVALPSLRTSLHASFSDLQWVLDAYALTLAVFLLTAGSVADRRGRKWIFNLGFVLFSAASLTAGLSQDMLSLNIARAFQGVGAAVLFAVGPALIGQEFHGKQRGVAFGVFGGGAGLAIAFGPLIGGALTDSIGWRWIFLINVPIGVAATVLGIVGMRESRDPNARTIDWAGLVTFSVSLALLVLALLRGEVDGWRSGRIVGMFAGAAVLLVAFLLIERQRGGNAMLDISLFRVVTFNGIAAVAALAAVTAMSAIFLLVSYVQNILGYSPWATGIRFLALTLLMFVMAATAGGLTAKAPPQILVGLGCVFIAAGLALVKPLVHIGSSWVALLPTMACLGIGMGLWNPVRAFLAIGVAEPRKAGMASGINETFQQVGLALGIAAFGALFQARVTDHFGASAAGSQLGNAVHTLSHGVAAGAIGRVAGSVPPALSASVRGAARSAFVLSLGDTLLVSAGVAAVSALIGFFAIRERDLHESARNAMPGVPPDLYEELVPATQLTAQEAASS